MNPFDKILKGNSQTNTISSGGLYDDIISNIGTSTQTKPTGSKVLSALGDIGKSIAKLPLRAATNIDQALSNSNREIYSGKTFGDIKPIGTQTFDAGGIDLRNPKQGLVNTAKDLKDIAGASLETLSYLPFATAAKTSFNAGKIALGQLAKEGAVGGITGVAGQQLQQGGEFDLGNILKGGAFGAATAPAVGVLGSGISKIFGGKKAGEVIAEDVFQQVPKKTYTPPDFFQQEEILRRQTPSLPLDEIDVNKIIDTGFKRIPVQERENLKNILNDRNIKTVKIYRASDEPTLKNGDYVSVYKPYAETYMKRGKGRTLIEQEIPKSNLEFNERAGDFQYVDSKLPNTISSIIRDGKAAPELAQQAFKETSSNTFTPKLSTELEASAIEKKFVEKFGDLPQVQTVNMKDESLKWADLVEKDYDTAKASVLNSQLPDGFNNSLGLGYEAVVRKATKDGDWQLLKELATNPNAAPTQASLTAQKLKSFDNNLIDSTDPIELMQSLSKARESVVDIKQKGVKKADIQTLDNVTKPKIPKKDWSSFIDSIPDC